ncbi:hypothetical protein KSW81_003073 [Nannochloris sp. 'desiccata']|nr:hypothetical protein KSW81_003073 [Chlorella desiccata (nom. nud.)]
MECTLMDVGAWRGLPQRRTMLCSQSELEEQLESSGDINGEEIYLLMVKYNLLAFSPYSALPRDLPQEVYGVDEEVVVVTLPLPVHNLTCPSSMLLKGSWSIGTFRGPSPLNLTPIESTSPRVDCPAASAWPAANPVLTCASVTDTPSNFVADPFIFAKSGVPKELGPPNQPPLHIFFETKSNIVMRGEIGVAESLNGGATWQYIGIALSEPWHLSYPYVFSWNNQVYMMPEGSGSGSLRLYRAVDYPLRWELEKELINKPLVDASLVEWKGRWYLFASDPSRPGHKKNAELQIFHSEAPLGPWTQHYLNPVMSGDPRSGARMAGRLLKHNDRLYRFGQDCSGTYGRNVAAFRIDVLSPTEFDQTRIKFTSRRTKQGIGAWNGVRRHHIDALQLGDGSWLAVMDGDWQESNPLSKPFVRRAVGVGLAWTAGCVVLILALADRRFGRTHLLGSSGNLPLLSTASIAATGGAGIMDPSLRISMGTWYYLSLVRETPAAPTAIAIDGTFSRFTVVITSFSLRINTLQSVVTHYSRCPSIAQILVVWNGEQVPVEGTITAAVPVNFRVERNPSLNNRFKPDGIANIPTRAVLSLDDDIMLQCADVENAFAEWRRHPEGLVGFHPRLLSANPGGYFDEQETLKAGKYNALFTGAVFMDADKWFGEYWSVSNTKGREVVDSKFSCRSLNEFYY